MKTTLNIDETVMQRLREEAARQQRTMSELVEAALRSLLDRSKTEAIQPLPPLPSFNGGGHLVDISNREALYELMDET